MSQSQTEQNILNAVQVVRHVHRETNALIAGLDSALAGRGAGGVLTRIGSACGRPGHSLMLPITGWQRY